MAKSPRKQVVFTPQDSDILEYLEDNNVIFSTYVKALIRKDMAEGGAETIEIIEAQLNKILAHLQNGVVVSGASTTKKDIPKVTEAQKNAIGALLSKF